MRNLRRNDFHEDISDDSDIEIQPLVKDEPFNIVDMEKDDVEMNYGTVRPIGKKRKYGVDFVNKKETEEETEIWKITMLESSKFKQYCVLPIACVLTVFSILLFMHWSNKLKRMMLYTKWKSIEWATHLLVHSTRNQSEIVPLSKGNLL
jgi:hypothetical protein